MPRWVPPVVVAAVVLVAAPAVALVVLVQSTDTVLPNVAVDGVSVAGLDRDGLREVVAGLADARLDEAVVVSGDRQEVTADREAVGVSVDVEATVEAAWSIGRSGFWSALADHVAARRGEVVDVPLQTSVDEEALSAWSKAAAAQLSREPVPAGIGFDAAEEPPGGDDVNRAQPTQPEPGVAVDPAEVAERLRVALAEPGEVRVAVQGEPVEPAATQADLDAVLPLARRAVSAPVTLTHPAGGEDITLSPADLAAILGVPRDDDAPPGRRLSLVVIPEAFEQRLGERLRAAEIPPEDATISLTGGGITITDGRNGFAVDVDAVREQVLEVATGEGSRTAELAGRVTEPEFTREDAEALRIEGPVSTFTTHHACCEARVTNIHRIADMVDGALIKPGETFSLNEHVGPRTAEKGFVPAGVIVDGQFEEGVGGGVSQFATTFFNAAFFAGVDILQHQPHSYYISRYPEGRESTLNYGSIDVVIRNNSPYGIIVDTSYTDTSITVTFLSHPWAKVEAFSSGRRNVVPGRVRDGFTITYGRVVTYPDGTTSRDEWTHTYRPEN